MRGLEHMTAIVTGGARGIGRAIALRLLSEGATVEICDRDGFELGATLKELDSLGEVTGMTIDVADDAAVQSYLQGRNGQLDIFVNNAAIAPRLPSIDLSRDAVQEVLNVNFLAAVSFARRIAAGMKTAGSGVIVNIASVNAFRGQPEMLAYNASKAALVSLTKTLAVELGSFGVRVVCVCPGSVRSSMWDSEDWHDEEERFAQTIPLGRFAEPEEIAGLVAFLCSEEASYMTGCAVIADGGLTARLF